MSASKEKKNRLEQRGEAQDKKTAAAAEQARKDRAFRRNVILTVVVIVLLVAAALVINSNLFYTRTTAVQVGDTKYSPAEVGYFFKGAFNQVYSQYYSTYGSAISSLVDVSQPLDTQQFTEDQTWADVVFEQAKSYMIQVTVYYDAAMKEGYTLNEEDNVQVATALAQVRSYANTNRFSSLDKYLAAYYGKGMDEAMFTALTEKDVLASRYAQEKLASLEYTDEELAEYYDEHADEMDYYDLYLYTVSSSNAKFSDMDADAKKTAAHEAAEEIAKADTAEAFIANVRAFTGDEDTNVNASHMLAGAMGESYKDWVMSAERKAGDTTVVDIDTGSYAILFLDHDDNDYNTVAMRHILIKAEAGEDGKYSQEAKDAATQEIQEIFTEWEASQTEENFATLAEKYSDDGSSANGGLIEDIYKKQMVPVVNDFLFAEGRQPGDTDIVFNESSTSDYVGCHLLYYVGEGENNRRLELAKSAKSNEDFNAMYEELSADYEAVEGVGLRFANLA